VPPALDRHRRIFPRAPRRPRWTGAMGMRGPSRRWKPPSSMSRSRNGERNRRRARRRQRWQVGAEGRIGLVKRRYQLRRIRYRGNPGPTGGSGWGSSPPTWNGCAGTRAAGRLPRPKGPRAI
jgi:hypothetical protein